MQHTRTLHRIRGDPVDDAPPSTCAGTLLDTVRRMHPIAFAFSLSLLTLPACGKKADDKGGAAKATDPGAAAPAAGGPVKSTPKDLFAEFSDPKADGMKLLDKYH